MYLLDITNDPKELKLMLLAIFGEKIQDYHLFPFETRSWKKGIYYVIIQSELSIKSKILVIL